MAHNWKTLRMLLYILTNKSILLALSVNLSRLNIIGYTQALFRFRFPLSSLSSLSLSLQTLLPVPFFDCSPSNHNIPASYAMHPLLPPFDAVPDDRKLAYVLPLSMSVKCVSPPMPTEPLSLSVRKSAC